VVLFSLLSSKAIAADVYQFNVSGNYIAGECRMQNRAPGNRLQLAVPEAERGLRVASAKLDVCPVFGNPISKTLHIPLPMSVLSSYDDLSPGESRRYKIDPAIISGMDEGAVLPDVLLVVRLSDASSRALELKYVDRQTGEVKIGPIRVYMSEDLGKQKVPGFDEDRHLPIQRMEIDYQNVTLKMQIRNIR
jgi:hypothetical protein